jgi:hypothetical protein
MSGRRGRSGSGQPAAGRPASGRPGSPPAGADAGGEHSVFVPGYRNQRTSDAPAHHVAEPDAGPVWPVSASDWMTSKGPVRGYPPTPGLPPVRYPAGQFAAWNRDTAGDDSAVLLADGDPGWSSESGSDWGQPWYPDAGPDAQDYDGGYSALAPGDPALVAGDPALAPVDPAGAAPTQAWPTFTGPDGADASAWPGLDGGQPGTARMPGGPDATTADGLNAAAAAAADVTANGAPARTGGRAADPAGAGGAGGRERGSRAAAPGSVPARGPSRRPAATGGGRRKGRSSAILAVSAVVVLALAAVTFLVFVARHHGTPTAAPTAKPKASSSPSASPSPTLGPFGHIASRTADPMPLTVTQLYPRTFTAAGHPYIRTATRHGKSCAGALVGTRLPAAVKAAKCSQVVRASYASTGIHEMGTIGVLNLGTAARAARAGRAAGAADFIAQVTGRRGPTRLLGRGTGIEEAVAKGHYLILMWSQFTGRHRPRTPAQRKRLESFMTTLFQHTANVSLTNRMVDGAP